MHDEPAAGEAAHGWARGWGGDFLVMEILFEEDALYGQRTGTMPRRFYLSEEARRLL